MEYLTEEELIEINWRIILCASEGLIGVLDANGLNNVIEYPKQFFWKKSLSDFWVKGSLLSAKDY